MLTIRTEPSINGFAFVAERAGEVIERHDGYATRFEAFCAGMAFEGWFECVAEHSRKSILRHESIGGGYKHTR